MRRFLILCCLTLLAACSNGPRRVETSLYFGFSKADGSRVPDSAWQLFLRGEAASVFHEGFTIIPAAGMWRESGHTITEPSAVIISVNTMDDSLSARIDSLREHYKKAFDQKSVMRVDIDVVRWDY